jgi:acetyl esterase
VLSTSPTFWPLVALIAMRSRIQMAFWCKEDDMPLHPQIQAVLETMKGQPELQTMSLAEARATQEPITEVEVVGRVRDLEIPGPRGPIPARLYAPASDVPLPALVYFHGGGWVLGSIEGHDPFIRLLTNRAGCAVLSVGYRLAPEDPFPAGLEDAYAATTWLVEHGAAVGVDTARIAVGGDSAGGTFATVVSWMARDGGPRLAGQLLICPGTMIDYDSPSRRDLADGPFMTAGELEWFYSTYLPNSEDRTDPRAAPLLNDDLADLPATLLMAAEYDPLRDEERAYAEKLRESGVDVTYSEYAGVIHNWVLFGLHIEPAARGMDEIVQWLQGVLTRT